jgi:hypothetical protein
MGVIVVTGELKDKLSAVFSETELRDEAGRVLGRFVPAYIPELDMTPEELAAALSPDAKTYTTAEVLAYVKGLVS